MSAPGALPILNAHLAVRTDLNHRVMHSLVLPLSAEYHHVR